MSEKLRLHRHDEIDRLKAQLKKAREALEPFAKQGLLRGPDEYDEDQIKSYFTVGELRAAARVHAETGEKADPQK